MSNSNAFLSRFAPILSRFTWAWTGRAKSPSDFSNYPDLDQRLQVLREQLGDVRLITDKQLRQKLGDCSEMTSWRLLRDGKLRKPRKLGNRNLMPEDEADTAIARPIGLGLAG